MGRLRPSRCCRSANFLPAARPALTARCSLHSLSADTVQINASSGRAARLRSNTPKSRRQADSGASAPSGWLNISSGITNTAPSPPYHQRPNQLASPSCFSCSEAHSASTLRTRSPTASTQGVW